MDKRKTQISLPLIIEEKRLKEVVTQHWNLTFARQGKISVVSKRMMAVVLAQIQNNDLKLKPYYEFKASDVVRSTDGGGSAYEACKKAFVELASSVWIIEDFENKQFEPRNIIDTTKTTKRDGFKTSYDNGNITIALNPALEDYFIGLAHHTSWELQNYMNFESWYSMRFWELLSAFRDTGKWYVSLDEYRKLMDCEKKYKDVNRLIKVTTSEPLEELRGTILEFTFEKVFDKFSGRGRPPVIGLNFTLTQEKTTPEATLEKWKKTSPEHATVITELNKKWKIHPATLVKHLPIIKMEGAKGLIKSFEETERSNRKIDSREKYCNKAIKDKSNEISGKN